MIRKLLCLSNGHGEDAIAVTVLQQLKRENLEILALPLVGEGNSYLQADISLVGPRQTLPSGGFIYMDGRQLWQDLQQGLAQLTLNQYRSLKNWVRLQSDAQLGILAVGDIFPLTLAWLSGVNYAFIGTAKSDYYLRNEDGWLPETSWIERTWGSVYLPWERWLMSSSRCLGVFPRDRLTAKILQQHSLPVFDYGNPMMDIFAGFDSIADKAGELKIVLLPGSRQPEAERNWQQILQAVELIVQEAITPQSICFLAAVAPTINLVSLVKHLKEQGWQSFSITPTELPIHDVTAHGYYKNHAHLILSQKAYVQCLHQAHIAIAMAGTATEQFVGLGKPVISFPGQGPQYTRAFASAQKRLLGPSLILLEKLEEIVPLIQSLLQDGPRLAQIAANGRQRMGEPGAANRIATYLSQNLFPPLNCGNVAK